jgi:hypothetical protein
MKRFAVAAVAPIAWFTPHHPEHFVHTGEDGEVKRLYRVTRGTAEAWERFEWRPLDEARHDRIMRQVYFGLEVSLSLPEER